MHSTFGDSLVSNFDLILRSVCGSQHQFLPLPLQGTGCTFLKGSDTEFCEGDGTENWRRGYRLPWSLLSAWSPSVSRENLLRLAQGHGWVVAQGRAGPHKDSRKLAEGWEICISSASFSDESTIESSPLLCSSGPHVQLLNPSCVWVNLFHLWSPKLVVDDTPLLIISLVFPAPWISFWFRVSGP